VKSCRSSWVSLSPLCFAVFRPFFFHVIRDINLHVPKATHAHSPLGLLCPGWLLLNVFFYLCGIQSWQPQPTIDGCIDGYNYFFGALEERLGDLLKTEGAFDFFLPEDRLDLLGVLLP
jgi:hypothetical protein